MFFFIGGIQPRTKVLDEHPRLCNVCGHNQIIEKRVDTYLSLFFIPLFPVKKGLPFKACENCGTVFKPDGSRIEVSASGKTRRCRRCKSQVSLDFSYCPYCGQTL